MSGACSPRLISRCESHVVRGVRYNVRRWGSPDAPPILFLHGTRDSSITFQFVVDALKGNWSVVAPDWRGHGLSQWVPQSYWFHEFLGDLDVLVQTYFGEASVPVVAHSLGGNIASIYAGLRPERVSHLVSLDAFGPLVTHVPVDVKATLQRFLAIPRATRPHQSYGSVDDMASRLQRGNRRLTQEKARFLADHSSVDDGNSGHRWNFDPSHEWSIPTLHSMEEWRQIWSGIRAPVLWIVSSDHRAGAPTSLLGEMDRRATMIEQLTRVTIPETGHNLHHDEPAKLSHLIEDFIRGTLEVRLAIDMTRVAAFAR